MAASNARSLLLFSAGGLAGLVLAGLGMVSTTPATSGVVPVPPGAIARVNAGVILWSDFRTQLEAEHGVTAEAATAEQRHAVLEAMLAEELLVQRGLEIGLPASHPAVREALVAGVQEQIAADLQARAPDEAELRARWQRDAQRYASVPVLRLRHFFARAAPGEDLAAFATRIEAAAQALRGGGDVAAIAAAHGLREDPRPNAAEQPEAAVLRLLDASLHAMARSLGPGEVSAPLAADGALHLLVGVVNRPAVPLPFDAVRQRVLADERLAVRERMSADYVRFLRGRAEIVTTELTAP